MITQIILAPALKQLFWVSKKHQKCDFTSNYDLCDEIVIPQKKLTYNKFEVSDFLKFEKKLENSLKNAKMSHFYNNAFFTTLKQNQFDSMELVEKMMNE